MKIAILTPTLCEYSGIDRVVERQAEEYSKNNKVTIVTLYSTLHPNGIEVKSLGMPKRLFLQRVYRLLFFLDFKKIKKIIEKLKDYDMIISHFYPMNWIAYFAKKKYGVKYIYYNHGIGDSRLFSNFSERAYMKLFGYFNRLSLKNADSAISISKFLQRELKRETGIDSKVVYNVIDKKKFRKDLDRNKIRRDLNIKDNEKLLLFVGRLSPHKNIHDLLSAFDIITKKIPNTKLFVVGKPTFPSYYKKLRKIANTNVIFRENVKDDELPFYYSAADLYVTASLWEGFDLPAAEAQACGKKVVAYDVGAHPEVIKHGILVKKKDPKSLADAVISLIPQ